jgi:hypothetical protein
VSLPEFGSDDVGFEEAGFEEPGLEEGHAGELPSRDVHSAAPVGVLERRPKADIYTVLLGVAAGALAIGCLVMMLEIWQYGPPWTFPWRIPINFR